MGTKPIQDSHREVARGSHRPVLMSKNPAKRERDKSTSLSESLGEFRDQHNNNKQTASAVLSMPPESMTSPECEMIPDLENGAKQDIPAASLNSTMPMPRTKGGKHLRWCRVSKEVEIKDATRFVCL